MFFSVNAIGMISSRFIMNRLVIHFGEFKMLLLNSLLFFISVYLIGQVTRMYQLLFLALLLDLQLELLPRLLIHF